MSAEPNGNKGQAAPGRGRMRWWGGVVTDGSPPRRRWVIRWGRIAAALGVLCLIGYLGMATALWAYYTSYRKIPGVKWVDIAVLPRFGRVQAAIGAHYLAEARRHWQAREYTRGLLTARAALNKSPDNLEARIFLASCWQEAGRADEALRVLRDGLARHAREEAYQKALVGVCLAGERFEELLTVLRRELPDAGARVLDSADRLFALAEARALLEVEGPAAAAAAIDGRAGLADEPAAVPLVARIDWDLGRRDEAFARLRRAVARFPENPGIHDAFVDTAVRLGRADEARTAAVTFLRAFPDLATAQLRYIEAHGSRQGPDRVPWTTETLRYLLRNRQSPQALQQLANLAAVRGWSDLTYLLYQHALTESLGGYPFVVFHVLALVRAGDPAAADAAWRSLSQGSAERLATFAHIGALVAWSAGRQPEALQAVARLRRDVTGDPRRVRALATLFRRLDVPQLADEIERAEPAAPA